MRKVVLIALALLLPLAATAGDLEDLIAGVRAHYSKAKDLTVDFEQIATLKTMGGQVRKAYGTIYLKQPDKLRWVYTKPTPKEIISDGNTLVLYYAEEKKAYLSPVKKEFDISTPVSILTGKIDLKKTFTPELLDDENGLARVKLTPKKPAGYQYLIMHINRNGFSIKAIESVDAYGNVTLIKLSNPRFNTGIPDSRFVFTPIEGVEIIDAPMMDFR